MKEVACVFGAARSLVGVITDPSTRKSAKRLPAVIFLNSGIVHRVGPNRLYVRMARRMSALGFVAMRFDFSGIGDSPARRDNLPFLRSAVRETREAMDYLEAVRGINRFVLIGICSGAAIALKTAFVDTRVVGVAPINSRGYMIGSPGQVNAALKNRALLRHYWRIAFSSSFRAKNWLKAFTGKVNYRSLVGALSAHFKSLFFGSQKPADSQKEDPFKSDLRALMERGVRLRLIHAEGDEGLDYVQMVLGREAKQWSSSTAFGPEIIYGANHTFALLWSQEKLLQLVCAWAEEFGETPGVGRSGCV